MRRYIVHTPSGDFTIRAAHLGEPPTPLDRATELVQFFFTSSIRSRQRDAIEAAIELVRDCARSPLLGLEHEYLSSELAVAKLEQEVRRAFQARCLVIEKVDWEAARPRQGVSRPAPPLRPVAPVARAVSSRTPKTEELPVRFELSFVDEFGDAIPGLSSEVLFRHDGTRETIPADGAGVAHLNKPHGGSTAWARLADEAAVNALRDAVKPLWDQPSRTQSRKDRIISEEDDTTSLAFLRSPLKHQPHGERQPNVGLLGRDFRLVTDEPHRVSVRPWVELARLRGLYFDTNKCFLLPTAIPYVKQLAELYQRNPGSPVLVVGHTDATGEPEVNDPLSLERAQSMVAYLTDDVEAWLEWYGPTKPAKKRWGPREDKLLLRGMSDYRTKPAGEDSVRWYQRTRGLSVDGIAGPETRRALITEYMSTDGTTVPPGTVLVAHGCGEHFPLPEPPPGEQAAWDRHSEQERRRVELFFFDPLLGIQPAPPSDTSAPGSSEYPEWVARSSAEYHLAAESVSREVTVVEMHDALFRTNSCVVLPEGEDPTQDADGHLSLTSVGIVAASLRYNQEQPPKKLLVAGHCDTTGTVEFNQTLSDERAACALALLVGDRDQFRNLCHERHQVADYKQILSWVARTFDPDDLTEAFDCDPGVIDNVAYTGIEPVRCFQRDYNRNRAALGATGPLLDEDGAIGPLTWGAVFDCYEFALRKELGEDPAGLHTLRTKLTWVDPNRPALGFSEHHPIDHLGRDNYRSQANRRVEVLFFEHGEEPDLDLANGDPEMSDIYLPGKYQRDHLGPMSEARLKNEPLIVSTSAAGDREVRLEVLDAAGEVVMSLGSDDAEVVGRELCFELSSPSDLPLPCSIVTSIQGSAFHRTAPLDPIALRETLQYDSVSAAEMMRVGAPTLAKSGTTKKARHPTQQQRPSGTPFLLEVQWENPKHRFLQNMVVEAYEVVGGAQGTVLADAGSGPGWKAFHVPPTVSDLAVEVRVPSPAMPSPLEEFWQRYSVGATIGARPAVVPTLARTKSGTSHYRHPRVKPWSMKSKGAKPGAAVAVVGLDMLFLDVSKHIEHLPGNDQGKDPGALKLSGTLLVLEYTGGAPVTWLVLVTKKDPGADDGRVLLMFRHEVTQHCEDSKPRQGTHTNSDDVLYHSAIHYFKKPVRHGTYYPDIGKIFANYPPYDWDKQIEDSEKGLFFLMPLPHAHSFGKDFNTPTANTENIIKSLLVCLHASDHINRTKENSPAIGRLAIAGFSSGTTQVFAWCRTAWKGLGVIRFEEVYLFDGKAGLPIGQGVLEGWFKADPSRRRLRLVGTAYTEAGYKSEAAAIRSHYPKHAGHVWVRPTHLLYWYRDSVYFRALTPVGESVPRFTNASNPGSPLPSRVSQATRRTNVYFCKDNLTASPPKLTLTARASGVAPHTSTGISHVEAASLSAYRSGIRAATKSDFDRLMVWLRVSDDPREPHRVSKVRHPWSVFGGEMVGDDFLGYLTLCLRDSGF